MKDSVRSALPERILLIGAGQMAIDYAKVLKSLNVEPVVLGRGAESAARFEAATGLKAGSGPLPDQLAALQAQGTGALPDQAIVAVNARNLAAVSAMLPGHGIRRLLIEKPAALDLREMADLLQAMRSAGARAWVAYNRRFLASVAAADRIIAADGGALSVFFNFSEPAHRIAALGKPARELTTWFYGNSTHVVDLALYFAGLPASLHSAVAGGSVIDPQAGIFTGHGISCSGCHLAWHANWIGPGRWGVEVVTRAHRLIFQPLEKLRLQSHASFAETEVALEDHEDQAFKPGLLAQTRAFLSRPQDPRLLPLEDHAAVMQALEAMRSGQSWSAAK